MFTNHLLQDGACSDGKIVIPGKSFAFRHGQDTARRRGRNQASKFQKTPLPIRVALFAKHLFLYTQPRAGGRMAETMRAMGATGDGVEMIEIPKPTPGPGEVRVKVIASAVNAGEEKVIGGDFVGRFLHAKTSPLVPGWDFAGTIDVLGDGVTYFEGGAAVWGHLAYSGSTNQGTFAEYVTLPRAALAAKPDDVPYHVAAPAATVAMTSLQSLRDLGGRSVKAARR